MRISKLTLTSVLLSVSLSEVKWGILCNYWIHDSASRKISLSISFIAKLSDEKIFGSDHL